MMFPSFIPGGESRVKGPEFSVRDGEVIVGATVEWEAVSGAGLHGSDRAPQGATQRITTPQPSLEQKGQKHSSYSLRFIIQKVCTNPLFLRKS